MIEKIGEIALEMTRSIPLGVKLWRYRFLVRLCPLRSHAVSWLLKSFSRLQIGGFSESVFEPVPFALFAARLPNHFGPFRTHRALSRALGEGSRPRPSTSLDAASSGRRTVAK